MSWLIKQTIDLQKGGNAGDKPQSIRPLAYPGNGNAHRWEVEVLNGGSPADLSGYSASAEFDRQDGNRVASVSHGVTGNVAWAVFPADVYNIEGIVKARLSLSKTGEDTPISAITFRVNHKSNGPVVDPGGVITLDVAQLISAIETAVASIPETWTELSGRVDALRDDVDGNTADISELASAVESAGNDLDKLENIEWQYNELNSRNLLDDYSITSDTQFGVTCTYNSDKSVTFSGTNTHPSGDLAFFYLEPSAIPDDLKKGGYYRCQIDSNIIDMIIVWYSAINPSTVQVGVNEVSNDTVVHVPETANYCAIYLRVSNGATVNETVHPFIFVPIGIKELSGELEELKSAIKISSGVEIVPTFMTGRYFNLGTSQTTVDITSPASNSNLECAYIACKPGDIFYYSRGYETSSRGYGFLSSASDSNNIVYRSPNGAVLDNERIVAPDNAVYAVFNWHKNYSHQIIKVAQGEYSIDYVFATVAQMRSSTDLADGMIVQTLGYNSATDGLGCYYKLSNNSAEYGHTGRVHIGSGALYAIPMLNISTNNNKPNGPVTELVRLAETYQQSGKAWYGSSNLPHDTYPTCFDSNYVADTYNMTCSTLSRLMLYGIDFANSKYGGGDNTHKQGYWADIDTQFSFSQSPVSSAAEQALYCAYKGWAYYPDAAKKNIRPGDLCFFSWETDANNAVFMSISHVAIYLGPGDLTSDGKTHHHFIGNNGSASDRNITTFFYTSDDDYMSHVVLCAGFSKEFSSDISDNIVIDSYVPHTVASETQGIYTYELVKELKSLTAYTIILDGTLTPPTITLAVGADLDYKFTYTGVSSATIRPKTKRWAYHLLTPDISALTTEKRKQIRVYKGTTDDSYTLSEFKVYEGWI